MKDKDLRPVKIVMKGRLIDKMDSVLQQGLGGLRTRHKFVEEAVEYYIHELVEASNYDLSDDAPRLEASESKASKHKQKRPSIRKAPVKLAEMTGVRPSLDALQGDSDFSDLMAFVSEKGTTISADSPRASIDSNCDLSVPATEPLLGLHNRDWPSLQALDLLGMLTTNGPIPLQDYFSKATANGWLIAQKLSEQKSQGVGKVTAILPTNVQKPQAAESNYRNFSVGWLSKPDNSQNVKTNGPLFVWTAIGLVKIKNDLLVGLTESGTTLLKGMKGLSPFGPHAQDYAEIFLSHLAEYGRPDWTAFYFILKAIERRPTRSDLLEKIQKWRQSTDSVAASLAQGYAARGREWGLIEPKQTEGRYVLTNFGEETVRKYSSQ